ncbi:hypothetical protein [Brucella intermedia]|uniref:hypothetical protein n=1 Tax=Brucella intermedia TaxID=94625 RepID=UPI0024499BA6|nr:hypothetical protein [Brucella intermedia]WGG59452.1 hypothetical protein QA414_00525 [Brucella intermedia]
MSRKFRTLRVAHPLISVAAAGVAIAISAAWALAEDPQIDQRLNVGRTGIMCLRLPCPHRGIYAPGAKDLESLRRALLYADLDGRQGLPVVAGSPADQAEVTRAWDHGKCIAVLGRLEGTGGSSTLHVSRVIGPCN